MAINLINVVNANNTGSTGWLITLIILGVALFSLLMIEQFMTWIYIRSKVFSKPKYGDKIFILDYILLFICLVVAILITIFYANDQILLSAVIVWWIIVGIYLIVIIARFFVVNMQRKQVIDPIQSLNIPIEELARKFNINIDYHQYLSLQWKPNVWIDQVKFEYDSLLKQTQTLSHSMESKKVSDLLASIIVFYEKNILKFSTKKRRYISALTIDLVKNLQINSTK